ncbi:class I SAM-dependent methyltransferase [Streptomyces sp. NPDC050658]|uniref:class I SAM-dependent methyltransferase n=1 Tax=unclassified Streptomyces TaxID=2593676 RepID=UPI00342BFD53
MGFGKHVPIRRQHSQGHGGAQIRRARLYEISAAIGFLGRRRRVYDGLVVLSGARPGQRILDVGCGTGYFSRRAAASVTPGGRVTGIDPSQPMIEYATRRAPANCTFQTASAQELPFGDASFDVIVSSLAIHHLPDGDRLVALREMRRVLRPGGRLLLVDYGRLPRHLRLTKALGMTSGHADRLAPGSELPGLAEQAGFHITDIGDRWPSLHYVLGALQTA